MFRKTVRKIFGDRKSKSFEGIIGKKMWNDCRLVIRKLQLGIDNFSPPHYVGSSWTYYGRDAVDEWKKQTSDLDLYQRATKMHDNLKTAYLKLSNDFRNASNYAKYEERCRSLIEDCEIEIEKFIAYCETLSDMDKNQTWNSCELAVYLTNKEMKTETALKICKELGATKIQHLLDIKQNDIYGDAKIDYGGLSLTISEKNELHEIWLAAHREVEVARTEAELASLKIRVTPTIPGAQSEEMDEGTYTGQKMDGKRHGQGFMFYNNYDTYYGMWENDKMNGIGNFKKNVRSETGYDWEFHGKFFNNCPKSGRLQKSTENQGLLLDVKEDVTIFEWIPFPSDRALAPTLTSHMHVMLVQLQKMAL
jgi:hypothetical protein